MSAKLIIAGGGIGGLAAATACARAGAQVHVVERASQFEAIGAGVQLGPNVSRILRGWNLQDVLRDRAVFVPRLQVKQAMSGALLATLPLGDQAMARYGAPYVTLHRADLHAMLAQAAQDSGATVSTASELTQFDQDHEQVRVQLADVGERVADALIGADGVRSRVRELLLADGAPKPTGHLAFRALVRQDALPQALRSDQVTVWLGPNLHVVSYPVHAGASLNLVAFIHGSAHTATEWDDAATTAQLREAMRGTATALQDLLHAASGWRLWVMVDRAPITSAAQMARGRVALLGDAAHPMRPYLAQGAGMAIEDAAALAAALSTPGQNVPAQLERYAHMRWQRSAQVQQRARRNGQIFHATGLMRLGRDLSLRILGHRLLDIPWLYSQ
jgi:salicylate hydroxylase